MKKHSVMKMLCWLTITLSLLMIEGCRDIAQDPVTPSTDTEQIEIVSDQRDVNAKTIYKGDHISSYDNLDPERSGCGKGAYTVLSKDFGPGIIELRWSPMCKTNWSRVTRKDNTKKAIYAGVYRGGKSPAFTDERLSGYKYIWTNMVYASGIKASAYGCVDTNDEGWICDTVSQFPNGIAYYMPTANNMDILMP